MKALWSDDRVVSSLTRAPAWQARKARMFEARLHEDLASAKAVWLGLERDGRCTAFQRYDWARTVVRHLARAKGDKVVVVEVVDAESRQPAMLLPLILRRRAGYQMIEWLSCDVCDYAAPLLAEGRAWCRADALAAWAAIRSVLPSADLLRIDGMPEKVSGAENPLVMLPQARRSRQTSCGFFIEGDPESVLERCCSPSFVRQLAKSGRRLERKGPVRFVEAKTPSEIEAIFAVLLEQRRTRFRKLGRFDLLARPAVAAFYRDAALQGLCDGPARLHGLKVGDTWVGTCYGLVDDCAYQGLIITIAGDPWRHYALGMHVHAQVVKWARRQGLTYFDMSVGGSLFKEESGGRRLPLFTIDTALTLRGCFVLFGLHAGSGAKAWLQQKPWLFERLRNARRRLRRAFTELAERLPVAAKS